jgi:hypothetical protein
LKERQEKLCGHLQDLGHSVGGFVGVVQICGIKFQKKPTKQLLQGMLAFFVNTMADLIVVEDE